MSERISKLFLPNLPWEICTNFVLLDAVVRSRTTTTMNNVLRDEHSCKNGIEKVAR